MARSRQPRATRPSTAPPELPEPKMSFPELMEKVPDREFLRMVDRCGLPVREAQELVVSFRELKS